MQTQRLNYLLEQFFQKSITELETAELNELLSQLEKDTPLEDWMKEKWADYTAEKNLSEGEGEMYFQRIQEETREEEAPNQLRYIPLFRKHWSKIAAIFILGLGGFLIYLATKQEATITPKQIATTPLREDVEPGGNYATLTLGDGSKVVLDSLSNGLIANQGNTKIIKLNNGELAYENANSTDKVVYNTMSTPVGGQYQLTLPDGTGIWLNAASSITYPTAFTGKERNVTITGEVYFEVAKNPRQPFKVKTADQVIEVLGTHFNVNTYSDEQTLKTTLVEGKVKVTTGASTLLLQPGQQAKNNQGNLQLNPNPDLEETLAWKNGLFQFNGTNIETIMRNVARWYGVEVVYKDKIEEQFVAEIPRNVNVSKLLELLELTKQVKFSVNNKVITVSK
ncbi:FecR family protein [Flavihumibacter sp. UBA7668]|uniref:FecR family protein n=1 Tax=Flavihumibacter sp. UBA7668 TaxID=1946542 RepID=UPI0025BD75A9|nr:FecR family protein [Flavihumibacter sp. UBA7668]